MQDTLPMTIESRRIYLAQMRPRYHHADRAGRGALLTEMEAVTGLHRKSLLRLLAQPDLRRRTRQRQRTVAYDHRVTDVIRVVWESLDYICAERLTPALATTAEHLAAHGELTLSPVVLTKLTQISIATVQRRLRRLTQDTPRLPRKRPEQANRLTKQIPVRTIAWNEATPGHFEVDLVHHGGSAPRGDYGYTLQMIDVATGWSERVAVLGRGQRAMETGFRRILARLPFPIHELHSDNGSEFLNDHLVRFWGTEVTGMQLSRSRPYQKNDNRFVEQKNATLVRAYLGQACFDTPKQIAALNALYDRMWWFYNAFQPVLRLRIKERTETGTKRTWDTARTPLDRLLKSTVLTEAQRTRLITETASYNVRRLRRAIYRDLDALLGHPVGSLAWEEA